GYVGATDAALATLSSFDLATEWLPSLSLSSCKRLSACRLNSIVLRPGKIGGKYDIVIVPLHLKALPGPQKTPEFTATGKTATLSSEYRNSIPRLNFTRSETLFLVPSGNI